MASRTPSSTTVATVRRLGSQLMEMAQSCPNPNVTVRPAPCSSVVQVMAHLVTMSVRYAPQVAKPANWPVCVNEVAEVNDSGLAELDANDLPKVVATLRTAIARLPSGPSVDTSGAVPFTGGVEVVPADLYGLMLGEFIVHGHDIASTLHRSWPIEPEDALDVVRAVTTVLPGRVDHARTCGLDCVIEVRVRGDRRYVWQFTDGDLVVDPPAHRPVDVTISTNPGALVLLCYGRLHPWRGLATGQLRTWGRRPRLAFDAAGFFHAP